MAAINKLPFGLLGFLGIKTSGQYPLDLGTTLLPSIDLQMLYFRTNFQPLRITPFNLATLGFTVVSTVPDNQVWAVHGGGVNSSAALGAGVSVTAHWAAAVNDGAGAYAVTPLGELTSATTGQAYISPMKFPLQILPPGAFLGMNTSAIAAGPIGMAMQLWYSRLDT